MATLRSQAGRDMFRAEGPGLFCCIWACVEFVKGRGARPILLHLGLR